MTISPIIIYNKRLIHGNNTSASMDANIDNCMHE